MSSISIQIATKLPAMSALAHVYPVTRLLRPPLSVILMFGVAACLATPMRWERPGTPDANRDEAECRAQARQQAIDAFPYGDGPPLYGFTSNVSMLQWKMAIDDDRAYLEEDLTRACMHQKGFLLVPVNPPS